MFPALLKAVIWNILQEFKKKRVLSTSLSNEFYIPNFKELESFYLSKQVSFVCECKH